MNNLTTLAAIATFATCVSAVARADTVPERRSETVQFADLDTTNIRDVVVLYGRIKNAAENVCRDLEPGRELSRKERYSNCVQTAFAEALVKVDRPALTSYAVARGALRGKEAVRIARNN